MLRRQVSSESGVTLVELLVAMVILGVIFSGVASFLINSARVALANERRVMASAVMTAEQERLQAVSWEDLALYEDEVSALQVLAEIPVPGLDLADGKFEFEGREIVVLDGPNCPEDESDCSARRTFVPAPTGTGSFDSADPDGLSYVVARIITWIDRTADGSVGDVKRITTLIAWQAGGDRWIVERFDSERAASTAELGDPTRVRLPLFHVGPELSGLEEEDQRNSSDITLRARFNASIPNTSSVVVSYWVLDQQTVEGVTQFSLVPESIVLDATLREDETDLTNAVGFEGVISAGQHRFPIGQRPFRLHVEVNGEDITAVREIGFLYEHTAVDPYPVGPLPDPDGTGGDDTPPPSGGGDLTGVDVAVTSVTVLPDEVCVDADHEFEEGVTVTAVVNGMTDLDWNVTATYVADGISTTSTMLPDGGAVGTATGQTFRLSFESGFDHGFRPEQTGSSDNYKDDVTVFIIEASRDSDGTSDSLTSQSLSVGRGKNC